MRAINMTNRSTRLLTALVAITVVVAAVVPVSGAIHNSARSAAMGGAFTALAKGVEAAKFNPANLGLTDYRQNGLELISIGASINNNSFTLADYNTYTGATLTTADKQDILDKIPTEGLRIDTDIRASGLSLALGRLALNISAGGSAKINLSKDIIEVLFNGNSFADTINVTGSYSDAISYGSVGLSYGFPIYSRGTRQLSVGVTAKYLKGIAVEEIVELEGSASTTATGFVGQGRAVINTASGGSGYGFDAGLALKLNDTYTAGIRFENILNNLSWGDNAQEHGFDFVFDTVTVELMGDDMVNSEDYSIDIASFSTKLPATMNVGFAKASGKLLWAIDWIQGFKRAPGASTKPRIALGSEYALMSFLPLRAGYATGGDNPATFSFGSGIHAGGFYLDMAFFTGSSFSVYSAKGANIAFSTGVTF